MGRSARPWPFVLLLVNPVRFTEILRRQRARVVRHLASLFDNLADKDFGETADDGQNRRRDGLLQDRVDELSYAALGETGPAVRLVAVHLALVKVLEQDAQVFLLASRFCLVDAKLVV